MSAQSYRVTVHDVSIDEYVTTEVHGVTGMTTTPYWLRLEGPDCTLAAFRSWEQVERIDIPATLPTLPEGLTYLHLSIAVPVDRVRDADYLAAVAAESGRSAARAAR